MFFRFRFAGDLPLLLLLLWLLPRLLRLVSGALFLNDLVVLSVLFLAFCRPASLSSSES